MQELQKRHVLKPKGSGGGSQDTETALPEVEDLLADIDSMLAGAKSSNKVLKRSQSQVKKESRGCGC